MKKIRIFIGIAFLALAVLLTTMVGYYWKAQVCGVDSLVAEVVFYSVCIAGVWYALDQTIKEHYESNK